MHKILLTVSLFLLLPLFAVAQNDSVNYVYKYWVTFADKQGMLHGSNGTSFSTPIMDGMMACLWQCFPSWTLQQLCDSVRAWGNHAYSPDNLYGYGIPNFWRALDYLPEPDGISEFSSEAPSFKIYPNPSHGVITVELDQLCTSASLVVTDMTGRVLGQQRLEEGVQRFSLDTGLPAGFYLITVTTETASATQRLVVVR